MCIFVGCISDHILAEMYILESTFGDHIFICILVTMHTFWRRCAFGRTYLHLYFGYNAHILEDVPAFEGSHLYLHFGCNALLFWRRCAYKYNCIHIFIEEMTLIKYYCNPYHISSRIEENKTSFASWINEPHTNPIISHFR